MHFFYMMYSVHIIISARNLFNFQTKQKSTLDMVLLHNSQIVPSVVTKWQKAEERPIGTIIGNTGKNWYQYQYQYWHQYQKYH